MLKWKIYIISSSTTNPLIIIDAPGTDEHEQPILIGHYHEVHYVSLENKDASLFAPSRNSPCSPQNVSSTCSEQGMVCLFLSSSGLMSFSGRARVCVDNYTFLNVFMKNFMNLFITWGYPLGHPLLITTTSLYLVIFKICAVNHYLHRESGTDGQSDRHSHSMTCDDSQ